ncbi:DUF2553 family protein [Bacillus salacetis]|uniref:DUF2553 family protein n=1 Tax=Bacillus salacetis TaxID=2315464 RepID=A0A3A1RD64_9BACI|nr:DUF2553 family protein [Bacillus salacetis]RIW38895.1 DUF2553 family protein [Bacillus salacetis]
MLKPKKLDVTQRVNGKLVEGQLHLYLDDQLVGKMDIPDSAENLQLEPNFEASGNKIIQNYMTPDDAEPRYTDCDEGGWC